MIHNDEIPFPLERRFNPFDPATYVNLHERLAFLRESEPVFWLSELQIWCVSRFDDVTSLLSDGNFIKRGWRRMVETTFGEDSGIGDFLFFTDPPDHTRLRSLVSKAFVPRTVERLRVHTEKVCHTLLVDVRQMERCDLLSDYAWRIPMAVIAPLFDLPSTDHRLLEKWGRDLFLGEDNTKPEFLAAGKAALKDMSAYFAALIKEHRARPTGVFLDDLIAANAQGDTLNAHELVMMAIQLVIAGYDTTANQIANGIHCLLTYRENWDLLCANPGLLGQAVEEMMRYEPSALFLLREAVKDVTLHGKTVHAGDIVGLLLPAANRDPRRFEQPEHFDITRTKNPHVSFGRGIHTCLGAPLARLDIGLAIGTLTQNVPRLELLETTPAWQSSFLFRGLERLPVVLHG